TEHKNMTNLITGMSPVIHEYFLSKVLLCEFRDQLSVEYYTKEIGFDAKPNGKLAVICIEINYYNPSSDSLSKTDKSFLTLDLKAKIEQQLSGNVWLCQTRQDILACIIHLDSNNPYESEEKAHLIKDVISSQRED